ncbi:MAG: helix-turn-helix domain-containing protein [Pseudomonadales bacterium]|nr:helix-turn-helix domain-containing protein [Pseudomonadales bacterium]
MATPEHIHPEYFVVRGLAPTAPESLNKLLRRVLDAMPTTLYGETDTELTVAERQVLIDAGVDLNAEPREDPLAATAALFAAIIETSVTTDEAAKRLDMRQNRVRQMIARGTLYSVLLDNRRYIPLFQFEKNGGLMPNITKVNAALPGDLHPVDVYDWYTKPDPDLFVGDDIGASMSPLAWLGSGGDVKSVLVLVRRL